MRPHSALGYRPPAPEALEIEPPYPHPLGRQEGRDTNLTTGTTIGGRSLPKQGVNPAIRGGAESLCLLGDRVFVPHNHARKLDVQYLLGHSTSAMVRRYSASYDAAKAADAHAEFSPAARFLSASRDPNRSTLR